MLEKWATSPCRDRSVNRASTRTSSTRHAVSHPAGGEVEGAYPADAKLADDFLKRRTVGNAVEALGVVAFRASPVWVLAALSDVCGLGRHLIPEVAASLKQQGLLDESTDFSTVDQLLDGLERTSGRVAESLNTPPLDVPALREEWRAIREEARSLTPDRLPSGESVTALWSQLKSESARQQNDFETSSMIACLRCVGSRGGPLGWCVRYGRATAPAGLRVKIEQSADAA